jgi:hypothetical protein
MWVKSMRLGYCPGLAEPFLNNTVRSHALGILCGFGEFLLKMPYKCQCHELGMLREHCSRPGGVWDEEETRRTEEERNETRRKLLELLKFYLPSPTPMVIGPRRFDQGLCNFIAMLQFYRLNQNLMLGIFDVVLSHLMPEVAENSAANPTDTDSVGDNDGGGGGGDADSGGDGGSGGGSADKLADPDRGSGDSGSTDARGGGRDGDWDKDGAADSSPAGRAAM